MYQMYLLNALSRLMILFVFFCTTGKVYGQLSTGLNTYDSSVTPAGRKSQQNDFINHAYPYPAKPRNAWEIGVKAGSFNIAGDVRAQFPGLGAALHVRKALGYVFSLRAQAGFGIAKGLNFGPSSHYSKNPAWTKNGYDPATHHVFYNYKTNIYEASLQGVVTLNNIRFHKSRSGFNFYLFGGIGGMIYDTKIDALKGDGASYAAEFEAIYNKYSSSPDGFGYKSRKNIKKDLKNLLDGEYETQAETDPGQPAIGDKPFRPQLNIGGGIQIKLNKTLSLAIEDQYSTVKTDLLDGQQWQENGPASATAQTRDFDSYNFVSVGLNIAVGAKSAEPLWWLNPLDYAYSEINQPRHMKLPHPVLADADGDGIADQFDQEPNTPAGTPIDAHGASRDTDGDGVPDYKDKELITPTQCLPADAEGVGKCPTPACCDSILKQVNNIVNHAGNNIGALPGIYFKGRSVKPDNTAKLLLQHIGQLIRNNPECRIKVTGYGASSKSGQQLSWERVNAVIRYLVEQEGINRDRLIFLYGETGGEANTVDLRDANGEQGPSHLPPPYPQHSRH